MADDFNPDQFLQSTKDSGGGGFNPDAFLQSTGGSSASGAVASKTGEAPNIISDMGAGLKKVGSSTLDAVNEHLNPFSEGYQKRVEDISKEPTFLGGLKKTAQQTLGVGSALGTVANSPIDAAKAVVSPSIASPMASAEHALGTLINPEVAAKDNPQEMYEHAKEGVNTALDAIRPRGVPKFEMPSFGYAREKYELPLNKPGLGWDHQLPQKTAPTPPTKGPLGVTLSEGQETGNLPLIQREQAALRGEDILGKPAHERAKEFETQQRAEVEAAKGDVSSGLNPQAAAPITSPYEAADLITQGLQAREAKIADKATQQRQILDTAREQARAYLSPTRTVLAQSPLDAAEVVSRTIGQASVDANAATDAAYNKLRNLDGQFHPAAFNNTAAKIAADLNRGPEPVRIDPQRTPFAHQALNDLDEILSSIKQQRDPETQQIMPKEPNTPKLVEYVRQRLNTYRSDAIAAAKTPYGTWKDANAVGDIIDAFDGHVADRLKKGTFTGGDPDAVISSMKAARAKYADYRKRFTPQGSGDIVGPEIQKIVGRHEGQESAPDVVKKALYGTGTKPVALAKHFTKEFGKGSPELGAVRQGLYSHILEPAAGAAEWSPAKIADRIKSFTEGDGRYLTNEYLTPQEIAGLKRYEQALRIHDATLNRPQDAVDKLFTQLAGGQGDPASTQHAVNKLFNDMLRGEKSSPAVAQRLKGHFGENSPQFKAYKQGLFHHAIEPGGNLADWGPKKIADNLEKLLNVTGKQGANIIYSPADRALIQSFADLNRKLVVPQTGANWSNTATFTAKYMNKLSGWVGTALGAVVGHAVGLPLGVAEATAFGTAKGAGMLANRLNARQIAKQMPLTAEALAKYQKALAAYNNNQNPMSKAGVTFATANLSRTLGKMGIDFSKLPLPQFPGTVPADEQDQKRASGGSIGYAEGGAPEEPVPVNYTGEGYPYYQAPSALENAPGSVSRPTLGPSSGEGPKTLPEASREPSFDPATGVPYPTEPGTEGSPAWLDALRGTSGKERYQTWPEKMIRSGFTAPHDALTGELPAETTAAIAGAIEPRSNDVSHEPNSWGLGGGFHPSPTGELARVQDLSGMAGSGGMGSAETGAVGMAGGKLRPAIKVGDEIFQGRPGQTHAHVLEKVDKKFGYDENAFDQALEKSVDGFIDPKGNWLTRSQAATWARKNGVIKRGEIPAGAGLDSADLPNTRFEGQKIKRGDDDGGFGSLYSDSSAAGAPLAALAKDASHVPVAYKPQELSSNVQQFLELTRPYEAKYGQNWLEKLSPQELSTLKDSPALNNALTNISSAKDLGVFNKVLEAPTTRRELFGKAAGVASVVTNASRLGKALEAIQPTKAAEVALPTPTFESLAGQVSAKDQLLSAAKKKALEAVDASYPREVLPFKELDSNQLGGLEEEFYNAHDREPRSNRELKKFYEETTGYYQETENPDFILHKYDPAREAALEEATTAHEKLRRETLGLPELMENQTRVLDALTYKPSFTDEHLAQERELQNFLEKNLDSPQIRENINALSPEQKAQVAEHLKPLLLKDPEVTLGEMRKLAQAFPSLKGFALFADSGKVGAPLSALEHSTSKPIAFAPHLEQKRLKNFHSELMGNVNERAKTLQKQANALHESGELPYKVGTRFSTEHSRKNGLLPFTVTGHYVDPKNPGKIGYRIERGQEGEPGWERGSIFTKDPKRPEVEELARGFRPLGGPLSVVRAKGGKVTANNQQEVPRPVAHEQDEGQPQHRAHGGRVNPLNINTNPSEAQKQSGTYAKDHISVHGLPITIENAKGFERSGIGPDGVKWTSVLPAHYGYIKGTDGADSDHCDVYVGPHLKSNLAYIIDQRDHRTGKFDEHKIGIGFGSAKQFLSTYERAFSDGLGKARIGAIHTMTVAELKAWVTFGNTKQPYKAPVVKKLSHGSVDYEAKAMDHSRRCGICIRFVPASLGGPECVLVSNPISPNGWCNKFRRVKS